MLMDEWLWLPSCSYRPSLTHKACSLYSYPDSYNTRSENFQESRTYRYDCFKFKCVMCYWLTIKVFFRSLIFFIWNLIAQVHRKIYLKYHFYDSGSDTGFIYQRCQTQFTTVKIFEIADTIRTIRTVKDVPQRNLLNIFVSFSVWSINKTWLTTRDRWTHTHTNTQWNPSKKR